MGKGFSGNSHQRKLLESVVERAVAKTIIPASTNTKAEAPSPQEEGKVRRFFKSNITWGGVGVIVGARASSVSQVVLFVVAWLVMAFAFIEVKVFKRGWYTISGNGLAVVTLGVLLGLVWRYTPSPTSTVPLDRYTAAIVDGVIGKLNRPDFRITHARINVDTQRGHISIWLRTKNNGNTVIRGPKALYRVMFGASVLTPDGEKQMFDSLIKKDTDPRYIVNPDFEISPGDDKEMQVAYAVTQEEIEQLAQDYRLLQLGKTTAYVMVILEYGDSNNILFDDGIYRPHSVFCGYLPNMQGTMEYCNGYNYIRPKT